MSISSALNNAITGLTASSRMAAVVSSNLANAQTEGYGRRSVNLSAAQAGTNGGGVRVDGIARFSDPGLLADRRLAEAALTGQQRSAKALVQVEKMMGGVDGPTGLMAQFSAFERALISASSDPAAENRLAAAVARLSDVTNTLQAQTRGIQSLRQDADSAIAKDVDRLNTGLRKVGELNKDILRAGASGNDISALVDARQQVIDDIATIIPLRETQRENGTVSLTATNGTTLLDGRPAQFGFVRTPTITADMTLASGALSAITLNGTIVDAANGIGRLDGGSLGAAFTMRDSTLAELQAGLDDIAADLIARFQDNANDPTIASGARGILTDQNNPLDPSDLPGLAGRIAVNAAIDPALGGDPRLLRDGLNAATPGPSGDSAQLRRWIDALATPRSESPGASTRSAVGHIADFTSRVGAGRLAAESAVSFSAAKWDALHEAELANGVDTDFELQILLRVEQSYAANSKVIQAVNQMMQRLMEI